MSASEFSCVKFSNLILRRRRERRGLGRFGIAVDGGSVRSEPDRKVFWEEVWGSPHQVVPGQGGGMEPARRHNLPSPYAEGRT
jgi:hypothetical protein